MLRCMVDGERHDIEPCEGDELGNVIGALSCEVAKSGRFIASLKVNGAELDASFERATDLPLAEVSGIEITTDSSANLALAALTEGGEYLTELRRFLFHLVELYRGGDEVRGGELFVDLVTGLEWFVKVTAAAEKLLMVDFAGTRCGDRTLAEAVDSLNRVLMEIIVAQEQRDWVLLTDLLEYELAHQLEQWQLIFAMLRQSGANAAERHC